MSVFVPMQLWSLYSQVESWAQYTHPLGRTEKYEKRKLNVISNEVLLTTKTLTIIIHT